MSQLLSEANDTLDQSRRVPDQPGEFDYHPVPPLAPITLFLGVCAFAGLLAIPGLAIGLAGALTGLICLWQIKRSEGELGGRLVAKMGLVLSALFFVSGGALHAYTYATEVPEGYQRVSFNWLSKEEPTAGPNGVEVTPAVADLDEQPIFIKGYMFPTRQQFGLTEFVLVKDTGQCCFGGNPKITDMIVVRFKDGMSVNHKPQTLVSVAGTFHAKTVAHSGELTAIYSIDGTHFK
ncbi:MAG TPA: DUF3299 domain-containing protein [Planctomycetaceae bacterium]|nr:DUF3299 domain-containing protein [Planctomycetaceae bacterium]